MKFKDAEALASDFEKKIARRLNDAKGMNKKTRNKKVKIEPDSFLPDSVK